MSLFEDHEFSNNQSVKQEYYANGWASFADFCSDLDNSIFSVERQVSEDQNDPNNLGLFDKNSRLLKDHDRIKKEIYGFAQQFIQEPVDFFEFGVLGGTSFKCWVDDLKHPDCRFYGFDTFRSYPEAWVLKKEHETIVYREKADPKLDKGGLTPADTGRVVDSRAQFIAGSFQETVPQFFSDYKSTRQLVIHINSDLYSSCLVALTSLHRFLESGDIIVFGGFDILNEFAAFNDYVRSFYMKDRLQCIARGPHHYVFKLR